MIPFSKLTIGKEEDDAIQEVLHSGWVVMGKKTEEFEQLFAQYVGSKYAIFVDSCTNALLLAIKYQFGNEKKLIGVPTFTFVATAAAVVNAGHEPVFFDCQENDYLADFSNFNYLDNILPVHLGGKLFEQKAKVYDSAHRIEKDDVKEKEGLWCYSFYATKNMTTIQGGMVATNDENAARWLRKARDHGLDLGTKERYQGKYLQYDVEFVGHRVKADDIRAAMGIVQLKKLPLFNKVRQRIVEYYNRELGYKNTGNHLYIIRVSNQQLFMEKMLEKGIQCAVHYRPLHTMTAFKDYKRNGNMENSEKAMNEVCSLPLYPLLSEDDIERVVKATKETGLLI